MRDEKNNSDPPKDDPQPIAGVNPKKPRLVVPAWGNAYWVLPVDPDDVEPYYPFGD